LPDPSSRDVVDNGRMHLGWHPLKHHARGLFLVDYEFADRDTGNDLRTKIRALLE
jgi:hypothetical protein